MTSAQFGQRRPFAIARIIGASLSEPHTSTIELALGGGSPRSQTTVISCMHRLHRASSLRLEGAGQSAIIAARESQAHA